MILWKATAGSLILLLTGLNGFFRAFANFSVVTELVSEEMVTETEINYRANTKKLCEQHQLTDADLEQIKADRRARMAAA